MNGNNFVELRHRIWDTKREPGGRKLHPSVGKQYHTKIQTSQCNCFQPSPQMGSLKPEYITNSESKILL